MKLPAIFTAALLASSSLLFAQASTSTSTSATKPKPLPSGDKAFAKKAGESLFLLSKMSEQVRGMERDSKVSPDVSELAKKLGTNGDVGKAWAEIAGVISAAGEATLLPTELKGPDKTKFASLGKLKDAKYEKEFSELVLKETRDLVRTFESGAKMLTTPELKSAAEKYLPSLKGLEDDATKAKANHK